MEAVVDPLYPVTQAKDMALAPFMIPRGDITVRLALAGMRKTQVGAVVPKVTLPEATFQKLR